MQILDAVRETSPYRLLLMVVLGVTVLAQMIALVMVTESQVRRAQAHYAQQREAPGSAPLSPAAAPAASATAAAAAPDGSS
jgi:hypothetical protein